MDYKKTTAANTTITRDTKDLSEKVGNVYEALAIISKRANQLNLELKEELSAKLEEFATTNDNLEEIFENREQIEISKFYERLPKPVSVAIQELLDNKIYYRRSDAENTDQ